MHARYARNNDGLEPQIGNGGSWEKATFGAALGLPGGLLVGLLIAWSVGRLVCSYQSDGQSASLSVCQSVSLSVFQLVSRSVSFGLSVSWSVGLLVCRSVGLLVCRSVGLSVCWSVGWRLYHIFNMI